jgi:hypothetical protein
MRIRWLLRHVKLLTVQFISNGDYGIAISNNCSYITVIGNIANSNTTNGIGVDECNDVSVIGNACSANGSAGIEFIRFNTNLAFLNAIYTCSGNVLNGNVRGIGLAACAEISVTGNTIIQHLGKAIQIYDSISFTISGNHVKAIAPAEEGILIIAQAGVTAGDGLITGNRITGFTQGIREISATGTIAESSIFNNRVKGNTVDFAMLTSHPEGNDTQLLYGSTVWNVPAIADGAQFKDAYRHGCSRGGCCKSICTL